MARTRSKSSAKSKASLPVQGNSPDDDVRTVENENEEVVINDHSGDNNERESQDSLAKRPRLDEESTDSNAVSSPSSDGKEASKVGQSKANTKSMLTVQSKSSDDDIIIIDSEDEEVEIVDQSKVRLRNFIFYIIH